MSDILWAAIISFFGLVFGGPLVKWLIWDRVYRLSVDVEIYKTKTDPFTEQFLAAEARKPELGSAERDRLQFQQHLQNYIRLTIRNTSRKKIGGISLLTPTVPVGWAQVDDGTLTKLTASKMQIGELQPHHTCKVQIWSLLDLTDLSRADLKERFKISADEIDGIRMRFPMPRYLKQLYSSRFGAAYVFVILVLGIFIMFGLFKGWIY